MTWEERLLFLMFLDYKGALKKWERNHNKGKYDYYKIDHHHFTSTQGFCWFSSPESHKYWDDLIEQWNCLNSISVPSLKYAIEHRLFSDTISVGYQEITKEDALKIADFIYDCFGEEV